MQQESGNPHIAKALDFFNLTADFDENALRQRFHELAHKYHPDAGELTTSDVFNRLVHYRNLLKEWLAERNEIHQLTEADDYPLYKKAKSLENDSIIEYYKETEGNRIFLDAQENPALRKLQTKLQVVLQCYEKILTDFPDSIWLGDIRDSVDKIRKTWIKE